MAAAWTRCGKCRGYVYFARDGKGFHVVYAGACARWKDACALGAHPVHRLPASQCLTTTTVMLKSACIAHVVQDDVSPREFIVPFSL